MIRCRHKSLLHKDLHLLFIALLRLGARAVARERGESREAKVEKAAWGGKLGSFRINMGS